MEILFYSSKRDYGWLSNFHKSVQIVDNVTYWTNEHYYQSQKTNNLALRFWIASAPTTYAAMLAGRQCLRKRELREDWETIKFDVMLNGLRAKFSQSEFLKNKLLETKDAILHEDSPTDLVWGVRGQDMLGKLIMRVRGELKNGPEA